MRLIRSAPLLIALATFAVACSLYEGSPVGGNMFIKEKQALRVLLFGLSAMLVAIWYYLLDSSRQTTASAGDRDL